MRNLILSAFPRNMRLPDPFTPNLKVEMLPDISIAPRTVANYAALIKPGFKKVSLFLDKLQSTFGVRVNVLLTSIWLFRC